MVSSQKKVSKISAAALKSERLANTCTTIWPAMCRIVKGPIIKSLMFNLFAPSTTLFALAYENINASILVCHLNLFSSIPFKTENHQSNCWSSSSQPLVDSMNSDPLSRCCCGPSEGWESTYCPTIFTSSRTSILSTSTCVGFRRWFVLLLLWDMVLNRHVLPFFAHGLAHQALAKQLGICSRGRLMWVPVLRSHRWEVPI